MKHVPAIDCHVHLVCEHGYIDNHLREMDRLGIEQSWLLAVDRQQYIEGEFPGYEDNEGVLKAASGHPDRFVAFAHIRPDKEGKDGVRAYADQGFKGLKFIQPRLPYNHEKYFPVYKEARDAEMVLLFHTGVVGYSQNDYKYGTSSANMRPVFLDPIARAFPSLNIIGAHLGSPWVWEASAVARHVPNIHFDLSGGLWTLKTMDSSDWKKVFAWERMFKKILFGTDVHYRNLQRSLAIYEDILRMAEATPRERILVMRENAARIMKSNLP